MIRHILLMDDDKDHIASIRELLESNFEKCEVSAASTVAEGQAMLLTRDFDLFILDIVLPDGSGLDFAHTLRTIPKYALTWVVFISGHDTYALDAIRGAHCYDYIVKPYDPKELVNMVRKLLNQSLTQKESPPGYLCISQKGLCLKINISDILYIEVNNRLTGIHTLYQTYTIRHCPLEKIKGQLAGTSLLQCHRSFIVNTKKLHAVVAKDRQTYLALEGCEEKIPVGVLYKTQFLSLSR